MLDALLKSGITAPGALVLQAMAFAALHFQTGFPRGMVGVGLTFVYGMVLGELRRRADGLMAPFITHVLTGLGYRHDRCSRGSPLRIATRLCC